MPRSRPIFVLRSARHNRPRWFRAMTAWGPVLTERLHDARRFATRREAEEHPAHQAVGVTFFVDDATS
jgi:hypothetical protein